MVAPLRKRHSRRVGENANRPLHTHGRAHPSEAPREDRGRKILRRRPTVKTVVVAFRTSLALLGIGGGTGSLLAVTDGLSRAARPKSIFKARPASSLPLRVSPTPVARGNSLRCSRDGGTRAVYFSRPEARRRDASNKTGTAMSRVYETMHNF